MNPAGVRAGSSPAPLEQYAVAALIALCAVLYVPPATATPFFTKGEPREALVVRRMVENGEWILPRRASGEGLAIASKPPLFHWLGALVSVAAGRTTELTVRAPSVALATATVVLVWTVGRTMLAPGAALVAAVVLATSFEWLRAASTARVDAALTAFMTAGLLLFYRAFVRDGWSTREAVAAYLCVAAAALVKGPVGVVLPGLVVVVAAAAHGKLGLLPRLRPAIGAAIVLALVGTWYVAASYAGGEAFVRKQILKENVFRYVAASTLKSGHEHPFYYYFPALAAGFLPWTPLVIGAVVAASRRRVIRRDPRIGFLLVWCAVVFLFYSLASAKRSVYLLALYPAAALLTGWWCERLRDTVAPPRWLHGAAAKAIAAIGLAVVVAPLALVVLEGMGFQPFASIAPLLHPKDRANLPLVQMILDRHLALILFILAFMFGILLALRAAIVNGRVTGIFSATALFAVMLWTLVFSIFQPELARARTLRPFLAEVSRRTGGASVRFHGSTFDFGAAFYAPAIEYPESDAAETTADAEPDADDESDDDESVADASPARDVPVPPGSYLLIWDVELARLSDAQRADLEVLATSTGTDPKGSKHLVLARTR